MFCCNVMLGSPRRFILLLIAGGSVLVAPSLLTNTISILITEPGKNSPNLRNKRLARPSVTAPGRPLEAAPPPRQFFVVQCNVWQSLMLHTYSGWGQERQSVTAHIFHVLFPVGIWPLKNRACKVRLLCKMCANLKWLNFAKNVSLFSQSRAKHFAMRGISGMARSNCLALCFCRTFYETILNSHKKISFRPSSSEFVDLTSRQLTVGPRWWMSIFLDGRNVDNLTGPIWYGDTESREQGPADSDQGPGQLTDNWVRGKTHSSEEREVHCSRKSERDASGECSSLPRQVVILNCSDFTARYSDNLLCRQEIIRE